MKTPKIADGIIWQQLEDQTVTVAPDTGQIRVLNGVGTLIWQGLTASHSIDAITAAIVETYDVSAEQAYADLIQFLEDLVSRGILVLSESN